MTRRIKLVVVCAAGAAAAAMLVRAIGGDGGCLSVGDQTRSDQRLDPAVGSAPPHKGASPLATALVEPAADPRATDRGSSTIEPLAVADEPENDEVTFAPEIARSSLDELLRDDEFQNALADPDKKSTRELEKLVARARLVIAMASNVAFEERVAFGLGTEIPGFVRGTTLMTPAVDNTLLNATMHTTDGRAFLVSLPRTEYPEFYLAADHVVAIEAEIQRRQHQHR